MKKYYLNHGTDYSGPFSKEELREKKINKNTLVWSDDWVDWKKAGQVDELKLTLLTIPTASKTKEWEPEKSLKRKILNYIGLVISLSVVGAILSVTIPSNNINSKFKRDITNQQIRNQITSLIQVTTNQYTVNSWGGISNLNIIVYNNTDYTIDTTTAIIEYVKENGDVHKVEEVTFYNIPPHQKKSLPAPDSSRGLSVKTKAQTITSAELQICYDATTTPEIGDPDPFLCNK